MMKKVVRNYWTTPFWLAVALLSVCVAFELQANGPNQPNQPNQNFDTEQNNPPPPAPAPALQGQTHPKVIDNNNDDDRANQEQEEQEFKNNYYRQIREYQEYKMKSDGNSSDVVPPVSNELDQHEKEQLTKFKMELRNECYLFNHRFQTMDDAAKKTRLAEIDKLDKRMTILYKELVIQNKIFNACPMVYELAEILLLLKIDYLGQNKQETNNQNNNQQEQEPKQNAWELEEAMNVPLEQMENKLIPLLLDKNSANRTTSGVQQLLDKLKKHKVSVSIVSMLAILLGSLTLIPAKSRDNYWEQIKKFFASKSSFDSHDINSSLNKQMEHNNQHDSSFVTNTKSPPRNDWWWFTPVCAALLVLAMMVSGWILWSRSRNKPIKKQESSKPATSETSSTGSIRSVTSGGYSAKQQQKSQKNHRALQKSKKSKKSPAS